MESKKLPNSCWRCAFCGRTNPEEFICCRDCSNTSPKHAEYMDRLRAQLAELEKRNAELRGALEKIAKGSDDFHERSKYTDMACAVLEEWREKP